MKNTKDSRARYTSQQAADVIGNRYELVLIAAARARELSRGARNRTITNAGPKIAALQEIEEGLVGREYLLKPPSYPENKGKK